MHIVFIASPVWDEDLSSIHITQAQSIATNLTQIGLPLQGVFYAPEFAFLAQPFAKTFGLPATSSTLLKKGCIFNKFAKFFSKNVHKDAHCVVFLHRSDLNFLLFDLTAKQNPFLKPMDWLHVEVYDWFRGCSKLHSIHHAEAQDINFLNI